MIVLGAFSLTAERPCAGDAAMQAAVLHALGVAGGIQLQTDVCSLADGAAVDTAIVEPGARLGRAVRFRLLQGGRPVGYAIATAQGTVRHLRARRALAPSTVLSAADVEEVEVALPGQLLQPLPQLREVVGLTLVRPVSQGDVVTGAAVRVPPAVRSGDRVVVRSVVGGVEATATGTAQQTGRIGDVIRLVNAETRRPLRGRIVGPGEVEVIHGS